MLNSDSNKVKNKQTIQIKVFRKVGLFPKYVENWLTSLMRRAFKFTRV